jgi:hypothetical protein
LLFSFEPQSEYSEQAELRCEVRLAGPRRAASDQERAWGAALERALLAAVLRHKYPKVRHSENTICFSLTKKPKTGSY